MGIQVDLPPFLFLTRFLPLSAQRVRIYHEFRRLAIQEVCQLSPVEIETSASNACPPIVSDRAAVLFRKDTEKLQEMNSKPDQNIADRWVQHQRKHTKTTQNWACILCPDRRIFASETALWEHAKTEHVEQLDLRKDDLEAFKQEYTAESAQKRCVALSQGRQQNWPPMIPQPCPGTWPI
jgi:hypothetical protein